jgi:hypothetical protein
MHRPSSVEVDGQRFHEGCAPQSRSDIGLNVARSYAALLDELIETAGSPLVDSERASGLRLLTLRKRLNSARAAARRDYGV